MELFSTNKLFKEEKYEEILALWQNDESRNRMTDWDKWYVLLSLNKQKRYQETLDAYKLLRAKRNESTETELWRRIEDTVCRALYYAHVKTFDFRQGDSSKLFKQVDYILAHSSDSSYSVKGKAALFVVNAAEEGKLAVENASELIIRYLDAVNPSTLGREEFEYIDQQGNRRAKAPDREIWYAARAKALLKLQRYGECIACCDEALRELRGFHYSNDSWLRYRKAKCLLALGKPDDAKRCISEAQARGAHHWCLSQVLFEIERNGGEHQAALALGAECALADPSHEMRVSFYEDFADYLEQSGLTHEAALHRRLVILIRQENNWGLKQKHLGWTNLDDVSAMDKAEILKTLKPLWKEWRSAAKSYLTGVVIRVLPEGGSGFIQDEQGGQYYFNAKDYTHGKQKPIVDQRVRFTLVDKLDRKKNEVKKNAVDISII